MVKRTRAPRGSGSITPYGNGRFKGIITTGYQIDPVTQTKKRITKTFTGKTRKEVQQKITEYQYKVNTGKINPNALPTTFSQYRDRWLVMKKAQLKPQSYEAYETVINAAPFGDTQLKDISTVDINTYILNELQKFSPTTVKRHRTTLSNFFESARKEKLITENPVRDSISVPNGSSNTTNTEMHVLKKEEAVHFLETAKSMSAPEWFYPMIRTALETGMRKGELMALQFNCLGEDSIYVRQSVERIGGKLQLTTPKTQSSVRRIHVSKTLIDMLKTLSHEGDNDFVFHYTPGVPVSVTVINNQFKKCLKASGIDKPLRFHDLRHTHATLLIMAGVNIKTVSTRLGHSNVTITLNRYTHALPQQDEEASKTISSMLLSATTK